MKRKQPKIFTTSEYVQSYEWGFEDGVKAARQRGTPDPRIDIRGLEGPQDRGGPRKRKKLSAWNKFVKANSKKPRFIMRSGKLNLKKMGIAFRKTKK